eukprot:10102262-Alexandrium_andersonii.AAC.1
MLKVRGGWTVMMLRSAGSMPIFRPPNSIPISYRTSWAFRSDLDSDLGDPENPKNKTCCSAPVRE